MSGAITSADREGGRSERGNDKSCRSAMTETWAETSRKEQCELGKAKQEQMDTERRELKLRLVLGTLEYVTTSALGPDSVDSAKSDIQPMTARHQCVSIVLLG
ncbi:hypothetical protein IFM47457_04013 [Aspergillus lentulus]|nr:hypothetical protein IFM47457_04013 [Aspergillus lentulus]